MSRPGGPSFGQVVLVRDLPDSNGVNPKPLRPCVIITVDEEIGVGKPVAVAGISTLLPGPQPPDSVLLPFHRQGRSRTGLTTRCAAFARWVVVVALDRIARPIGHVPPADMAKLVAMLRRIRDEAESSEG